MKNWKDLRENWLQFQILRIKNTLYLILVPYSIAIYLKFDSFNWNFLCFVIENAKELCGIACIEFWCNCKETLLTFGERWEIAEKVLLSTCKHLWGLKVTIVFVTKVISSHYLTFPKGKFPFPWINVWKKTLRVIFQISKLSF